MCITGNKVRAIPTRLDRSMADLVSKNSRFGAVFRTIVVKVPDDRRESSGRSPVCEVGVSNENRSSSIAIGLSKACKWVFNQASSTLWCHTVVHFDVRMSRFEPFFRGSAVIMQQHL